MPIRSIEARAALKLACALVLAGAVFACGGDDGTQPSAPATDVELLQSDDAPDRGEPVVIAVLQRPGAGGRLAALQARVAFDATRLRFVGQRVAASPYVIVGPAGPATGTVRFAALDPSALPDTIAVFQFEALGSGGAGPFTVTVEAAASVRAGRPATQLVTVRAPRVAALAVPGEARLMPIGEWLRPTSKGAPAISARPGEGRIYGDADLNGAVDINDALGIALVSVSTEPLLSNVGADYAVAGNLEPANAPGLGEVDDPVPPGVEPDGSRLVNVLDALEIALYSVGSGGPVVGRAIPGRDPAAASDTLTGVLAADRTLSRDTVYKLKGALIVPNGVRLIVPAGTRVEAVPEAAAGVVAALIVRRGGRIEAIGTRMHPIVLTCSGLTMPGCWRGVVVNGAALLNNDGISGNVISCPTRQAPDGAGVYGGCLVEDDSGILRFVRIEFAGRQATDGGTSAGLALHGVGSGTTLDSLEVFRSSTAGLFVSGGRARLRNVLLSANEAAGLRWQDGWQGAVQELIVQHPAGAGPALLGSNFAPTPNAGPRSAPILYNVSLVGPGGAMAPPAVLIGDGSAVRLSHAVVIGFGTGLDIAGAASCALAGDSVSVQHALFFTNLSDFASDNDCVDEAAYALVPARFNAHEDPGLTSPFIVGAPDFRPLLGRAASTGPAPPADGFLNPLATYLGAVAPVNGNRTNVPWYAGWTVAP